MTNATRTSRPLAMAIAGVVAAISLVVAPFAAATAGAADSTTASSLFSKVNVHRASHSPSVPALEANGYINLTASEDAVIASNCPAIGPCLFDPADTLPTTPAAPTAQSLNVVHVAKGSSTASRLFTALLASDAAAVLGSGYNFGGVGVHTKGSQVYAVLVLAHYSTAPAGLLRVARPTISGTVKVGHALKAHSAGSSPAADSLTFAWKSGSTTWGTGSSFVVPAALFHLPITVTVTASKSGYVENSATSKPTGLAGAGTFKPGSLKLGEAAPFLFANFVTSNSPTPSTIDYQWYRNGKAIAGAASILYQPIATDKGKRISVKATLIRIGYATKTVSTSSSAVFPGLKIATAKPVISHGLLVVVGSTLTSSVSDWSPEPAAFTITWKANGHTIAHQHSATLLLTNAQYKKTITVTYTASIPIYATASATSDKTPKVGKLHPLDQTQ